MTVTASTTKTDSKLLLCSRDRHRYDHADRRQLLHLLGMEILNFHGLCCRHGSARKAGETGTAKLEPLRSNHTTASLCQAAMQAETPLPDDRDTFVSHGSSMASAGRAPDHYARAAQNKCLVTRYVRIFCFCHAASKSRPNWSTPVQTKPILPAHSNEHNYLNCPTCIQAKCWLSSTSAQPKTKRDGQAETQAAEEILVGSIRYLKGRGIVAMEPENEYRRWLAVQKQPRGN